MPATAGSAARHVIRVVVVSRMVLVNRMILVDISAGTLQFSSVAHMCIWRRVHDGLVQEEMLGVRSLM